jgi:hypothetical protein
MAGPYVPVTSTASVKVLGATVALQTERVSVSSSPTGILITYEVPIDAWRLDSGDALLTILAEGVEALVTNHHVTGGSASQDFDNNDLLVDYVDLIVSYSRASAGLAPLQATARVPVDAFFFAETGIGGLVIPGLGGPSPTDIVDGVYARLAALAGA